MMYHLKTIGHTCSVVLLALAATFVFNGCGDVSSVSAPPAPVPLSPDAKLSSLTVNPGPLQPVFSSDRANYVVDVLTTVTSVTVAASPQNATATMTINGVITSAGQGRTVTLSAPGSFTTIPIVVTAQNQSQNTYIVTVNRPASSDNSLSALSVTGQTLNPLFSPATLTYTVNVVTNVTSVTVSATKAEPNAVMSGAVSAAAGVATGQATINLNGPGNITPISITVTAPNGSSKIYTISVDRAALGGNNNLQTLTVSSGSLAPAFLASTTSYTVAVGSGVGSVTVGATAQDAGATVSINGSTTTSLAVTLNAPGLSTLVTIVVTAPNLTTKTYTVLVNRAALGGNNNLQTLTVSSGSLAPAFLASTTSYTVAVGSGVGSVTVGATAQDAGATVSINGSAATSLLITLNAPGLSTPISIEVTAPNGSQKTYTVTVNRAAIVLSDNNNLSALVVSAGVLAPLFDAPREEWGSGMCIDLLRRKDGSIA